MNHSNRTPRDTGQKRTQKQSIVCLIAMLLAVIYCFGIIAAACSTVKGKKATQKKDTGISMEYETTLFDPSRVHTIDIQIKENDWQTLKENALSKEYYDCTLVIDEETYNHVGVRTKGNSTLIQSMVRDWDRYSLIFDFGAFNLSQRYYGLDKISLYNNACDSSYLKNMISYDMMRQMGVPTPLCSYAAIYLNGEYVGLYIAMESIDESFAVRNFGYDYGQIYKPEQFDVAAILNGTTNSDVRINISSLASDTGSIEIAELLEIPVDAVALKYMGESFDSYTEIWDNAVFNIGKNDKKRLIQSIKNINYGDNLSETVNMEELARYFAVHNFVMNTDGYTTEMAHNYYLYEKNGKLQMIPWDYDQALGTVGAVGDAGDITEFINLAIDTPVLHTTMEERPILNCLLQDETGKKLYHESLQDLLDTYIYSGYLEEYILTYVEMITPYVKTDPTSDVSMEKFTLAIESVYDFCTLRSQSIQKQLDGVIPSTTQEQQLYPEILINASGFSSPDSGNFIEMLLPEGSDLGIEDALRNLNLNLVSIIKMLPVSDIARQSNDNSSEDILSKMYDMGIIRDTYEFRHQLFVMLLSFIRSIVVMLITIIVVIVMIIWIQRYGNSREPKPREKRKQT